MALQVTCDKGHNYCVPANNHQGEWPEGVPDCPECFDEWATELELKNLRQKLELKAQEKTEARAKRIADISASNKLGEKLCEVLGLDPMHVHSITVSAAADEPICVDVGMYVGDRELLEMDWHTSFAKAKITVKDHDETP